MSERRTAILAAISAVLGVWVLLVEGVGVATAPPGQTRGRGIVDCTAAPIAAIAIVRGDVRLTGKRSGERWNADVPADARDRAGLAFADLAASLCDLPILDTIAEPGALTDYGLEPARTTLRIERGERATTLDLGDATPAHNLLYARFREEPGVLQVGVLVRHEVEKVLGAAGS